MSEDIDKIKTEFISMISHELRTPLAVIKQLLMLIYNQVPGPINNQQREILVKAQNNIDRLKTTIDKLLDISNIERKGIRLRYSLVNINDLLREHEEYFRDFAKEKKIQLNYRLPNKDYSIFVDAERFVQIIGNLLTNAIKFTPEGGRIDLEVRILESKVRIGVIDSGIGIAANDVSRIFKKFVQVSNSETLNKKGIGLGLSIVKELVEKHGGEIWCESRLGAGSRFYFTLPRYHTARLLSVKTKNIILKTLEKGQPVYLLNVSIINYRDLNQKSKKKEKDTTQVFKGIAKLAFKNSLLIPSSGNEIYISNLHHASYSIIFLKSAGQKVNHFCKQLREMTNRYLRERHQEDVYVALGVLFFTSRDRKNLDKSLVSKIKEMYVGAEVRRYKRIKYKTKVRILSSKFKNEIVHSEDISLGGTCVISRASFHTDDKIKISLYLIKKRKTIFATARASWIKPLEPLAGETEKFFKIGLEFMALSREDKELLSNELKLYYE